MENEIQKYIDKLWPILRSLTGEGVRETHKIISDIIPLNTMEIPTGTKVFDWTIPKEWVVRDAYLINPNREKILDIKNNNLHLLNYSTPFKGKILLKDLDKHLFSIPEMPNAIPYLSSYYKENWGFCLSENQRKELPAGEYEVFIDTDLINGFLTLSDCILPGETDQEILISTYTCHPSLGNNELSGPLTSMFLYKKLSELKNRRLTYRFVFNPETIGSICYLSKYGDELKDKVIAGFVLTCIGDKGSFTYKKSRQSTSLSDRAAKYILDKLHDKGVLELDLNYTEYKEANINNDQPKIINFFPDYGSDERQYCSPGFDLPIGSIMKSMYGLYPEYHTSLDNKEFISSSSIAESVEVCFEICQVLEKNIIPKRTNPYCEPQLGKRNLYPSIGGSREINNFVSSMMWLLNYSDGKSDLLKISELSHFTVEELFDVYNECKNKGVLV